MRSAEGEVQNLGYTASFPSVINVEGQPTYIMTLKDKGSLVKQYALIHVERYNIVVTATTQREVMAKYKNALAENGILEGSGVPAEDSTMETVTVDDIKYLVQDGNSYAYLISGRRFSRWTVQNLRQLCWYSPVTELSFPPPRRTMAFKSSLTLPPMG